MNDASVAVERCERWRGPARQLQLAQIVVFDYPDLVRSGLLEQTKAAQTVIDIDAVGIDGDRSE